MRFQAPKGTKDVLPDQSHLWQHLEGAFREVCRLYGYREIRTPVFEETELFTRSSGDTSEVVTKQMYDFVDKGGRNIALKPESTAPAMRALIDHNLCPPGVVERMYYIAAHYRYEQPQKGRLREHHQCGLELVGSPSAAADAEVIEIGMRFLERIGLDDLTVSLNSIGRETCRAAYAEAILETAKDYLVTQSPEVQERGRKNPLRMLDWKDPAAQEAMKNAPSILDYLEPESKERLDEVQRLLKIAGIRFQLDPKIVRGLDYYTETVFEIITDKLGAQSTLLAGGRYDNLVKSLGGADVPSVGFGSGIERLLLLLETLEKNWDAPRPDAFIVAVTPEMRDQVVTLAAQLREKGFACGLDLDGRSMKSQMKMADRTKARFAIVVGPDEWANGAVSLRNLDTSEQIETPVGNLEAMIRVEG
ncbi:MAG: histidine--tRNA ligase [Fimbriimonadaceae bacterium]|nr:histidine--tRNA ligase [Fimbriimonadaceae bacterium]